MKRFLKCCIIVVLMILIIYVIIYIITIDTRYAVKYAEVFGSYNINEVDQYLSEDTKITYMGKTDNYKNLRNNVISAFEKREYKMKKGYSYGYGDDIYINKTQNVGIQAYVDCDKYVSNYVSMNIKRNWLIFHEIESLSSDDDFFGYLFFGEVK